MTAQRVGRAARVDGCEEDHCDARARKIGGFRSTRTHVDCAHELHISTAIFGLKIITDKLIHQRSV